MIWALVGHRGTGKTTLGRRVSKALRRPFVDIDAEAKKKTGKTPAELIRESLVEFRRLEKELIQHVPDGSIVSPGGGIEKIPSSFFVIWLWREGWKHYASRRRSRIRLDLSLEEELKWMEEKREPRFFSWADAKMDIGLGEGWDLTTRRLVDLIVRMEEASNSDLFSRSFWIGDRKRWKRQLRAWKYTKSAGIEIRSDRFPEQWKGLKQLPMENRLWSVRTSKANDLLEGAAFQDVDLAYVKEVSPKWRDSRQMFSSHAVEWEMPRFPKRAHSVKWAPTPPSFEELKTYEKWKRDLKGRHEEVTVLPQGNRWKWLRILETLTENRWNFISPHSAVNSFGTPPWDEWAFYAHVDRNPSLYGLIGDPVDASWGAEFHNNVFRTQGLNAVYVLIPVQKQELECALNALYEMGFKGLSVTSPLKQALLNLPCVSPDRFTKTLQSGNTLIRDTGGKWRAKNFDVEGMHALLSKTSLDQKSKILLIGQGGVSPSILKALEEDGFCDVKHMGYREIAPSSLVWRNSWDAVINASGRSIVGGPKRKASLWIDLRYGKMASNDGGKKFLSGEAFFLRQAKEQLNCWGFDVKELL